jgi:Mg2+/Co2+ transporter CorB
MTTTLIIIAFLLVLSAFFSGSETALTAASRPVMHQLEKTGNRRAEIVNRLFIHKEHLIGAILLGNNLVNIFASALATSLLIAVFGDAGVAYATITMTLLILIFSEILPKTYAIRNASQSALLVAPAIKVIVWALTPITSSISFIVRGILKIFGIDFPADDIFGTNAEELRGAIELHSGEDKNVKQERDMLRSVMDLGEVQVGEIIIHRKNITAVNANLPPTQLVAAVLESPYTRLPLWQKDPENIVGVLHVKALFREISRLGDDLSKLDVLNLAADAWFIPEQTLLVDQLEAFRKRREHFALVVDEYGSLMGVVTLEDIIEEIVGDIDDEHDVAVSGVNPRTDGSFIVDGTVTIRDFNREFEWDIPDEEASTMAGLVLHESRRIPEVGQRFLFHGFRFEILSRHHHQITQLRLTPPK